MIDPAPRRPRLTGVALLAPTAAALLAGTVAWATANEPGAPVAAAAPQNTVDPARAHKEAELAELRARVRDLRAGLEALPSAGSDTGAGKSRKARPSASSGQAKSSSGRRSRPKPTTTPKPARTTPPPVEATTGAS